MGSPSPSTRTSAHRQDSDKVMRLQIVLSGMLQGVGFRPFVFRTASALSLNGWVQNTLQSVRIEVEGQKELLENFLTVLAKEAPSNANIQGIETCYLEPAGYSQFEIEESDTEGLPESLMLPDMATCRECLAEIFDPAERRYLYPFTNCTQCGPRYTLIESLPYDRTRTGMKSFPMCALCKEEYRNPADRRFHAQPVCCPECGPHLELWDGAGLTVSSHQRALLMTVDALNEGHIIAIKGVGGFHLMTLATQNDTVIKLRERKNRKDKPFALLYPSLDAVRNHCDVSALEERLLRSPQGPIVLLRRKREELVSSVSQQVAPGNPYLGVMLPSNPLHHLLMDRVGQPVVCTSGNLSEEVVCTDEKEALKRLTGIADYFLVHNRPIIRHADDSIVQVLLGQSQMLRRARGYAPSPITLSDSLPKCIAVGGHIKNTLAWSNGKNILISPHLGDLGNDTTRSIFKTTMDSTIEYFQANPEFIACDTHPDYASSVYAQRAVQPMIPVQHHVAHAFSCMAENQLQPPFLAVVWDGSGYGMDGTLWGGEFFHVTEEKIGRFASFKSFRLPGGNQAIREPRRSALGALFELMGEESCDVLPILQAFQGSEIKVLKTLLTKNINCPTTSSCGRLFDAAAFLAGSNAINSYEGQAAMTLEFASEASNSKEIYPIEVAPSENSRTGKYAPDYIINWMPMIRALLNDCTQNFCRSTMSRKFHNTLAEAVVLIAEKLEEKQVLLTGGCFQNRILSETVTQRLRGKNFEPYWHRQVPPNDGGLALGQLVAACRPDKGMI